MANTAPAQDGSEVARVIRVLSTLHAFSYAKVKSRPEAWLARWSTRLLIAGVVLLALVAVMALVHQYRKLPPAAIQIALIGAALSQIAAVLALLAQTGSGVCGLVHLHRRRGELLEQEYQHDHQNAMSLQPFSAPVLDEADKWLEETMKRFERRQVRFFGGSDKLALVAVLAATWGLWKEHQTDLTSWTPSPLLFGLALVAGLTLGGALVSRYLDQLAYQRDVLDAARALKRASAPLARVGVRGGIARTLPAAALSCPHWNAVA